jgi:alkylation response protein AidB-like acyl-CoA dehydrogenase
MEFGASAEHDQLRSAVAKVAGQFGHGYFAERSRAGTKTDELWNAMAEHGFLGVHLPEAYGGGGAGIQELTVVCEEVAAAGCPLLLILVSAAICGELIGRLGTPDQQQAWLPALAAGEKMAFAITEADAGSNTHRLRTTATWHGGAYRLRGEKTYISGVDEARWILVVAKTGSNESDERGLSLLVVDVDAAGLSRSAIPVELSIPERQFTVHFDDVEVSPDRLLGVEHEGLRAVFSGLNPERITGAAICTGVGRYALERASEYATIREVWDVPIGAHQGIAHPLAAAKIELELARLMMTKAAWLHDTSGDRHAAGEAANMAKYAAAEAGLHCLDVAIQAHGGNGMASAYGLADLWGLVRLLKIAPVSREMILNYVAQHSLGLPRSY